MIGTGHVFDIAEPVSFIIKHTWPEAVLVELDENRFNALMNSNGKKAGDPSDFSKDVPKIYRESARYQDKMSAENGVQTGSELLAAINSGRLLGAEIVCIDRDAEQVMRELEEEMTFMEKRKYSLSSFTDRLFGQKKVESTQNDFSANEEKYVENMRKRYPTLVRKLIDERNVFMADKIRAVLEKYNNVVVVVGDAHVEGLCKILDDHPIRKIRLIELMAKERMDEIRSQIWNDKNSEGDSE
jgi:Uncharacterized homolog of PrgY (pheromone shutdown protein)